MRFSKSELRTIANARLKELRCQPLSESVFEKWIGYNFFCGASAHGRRRAVNPTWDYSEEDRDSLLTVAELHASGAKRVNQKIVILSLLGWEFPFTKVRDALKSEFGRFIKRQQRRAPWWQYHYKDVDKLKGAQRAKRIRQLPRLDPDLAATGLCLGDEAIFQVALRAHWGGKRTEIPSIIAKDLTEKLGLSEMLPSELFELLDIPGSWGSPGESKNAGYEVLGQMSEDDLRSARDRFYFVFGGLFASAMFLGVLGDPAEKVITAYSKGIEALVGPDWIIATMATFAISAFHNRTSRPKGAQDPFKVLDSLAESAVLSSRLWGLT